MTKNLYKAYFSRIFENEGWTLDHLYFGEGAALKRESLAVLGPKVCIEGLAHKFLSHKQVACLVHLV